MRWILWWGFVCWSFGIFGQGLNGELGFNDDYSQNTRAVVAFEDHSFFVKQQTISASFFTNSSLIKVDTLENILWEIPINPQAVEVVQITEMIRSENNGVYVLGYALPTCDVSGGCFWFLQKFDSNGVVNWTKTWTDPACFGVNLSGLSLSQNNQLLIHYNDPLDAFIYTFDVLGNDISSISLSLNGFRGLDQLSGYHSIAYKQFSIFGFDGSGNVSNSKTFSSFVSDAVVWNDTLFLTTKDSVFIFNNALQTITAAPISGYEDYRQLKVRNQDIRLISSSTNDLTLFKLNRALQTIESITLPVADTEGQPVDYSEDHLTLTMDFALSEHFAIRHLDYSLKTAASVPVNWTDIGIAAIQITQASAVLNPNFQTVFEVEVYADVLLKNYGTQVLESCRMNHYISPALACGLIYYGEEVFNLNLAPGDSVWIPLGLIHTNQRSFPSDSLFQDICIYTSFPNTKTDLNPSNDRICTTVALGTADLEELNELERTLIKVVDILGREVKPSPNQWFLYIYDDGSTEKVMRLE